MPCFKTLKDIIIDKCGEDFTCHTWGDEDLAWCYHELKNHTAGFYSLKGKLYKLSFTSASDGRGGMDQGYPATARITQVKKCVSLDNV